MPLNHFFLQYIITLTLLKKKLKFHVYCVKNNIRIFAQKKNPKSHVFQYVFLLHVETRYYIYTLTKYVDN